MADDTGICRSESVVAAGDFVIDRVTFRAWRGNRELTLSLRLMRLLELFLQNPGQPMGRQVIMDNVWGVGCDNDLRSVDAEVAKLRRAIGGSALKGPLRTIRNVGFVFFPDVKRKNSRIRLQE